MQEIAVGTARRRRRYAARRFREAVSSAIFPRPTGQVRGLRLQRAGSISREVSTVMSTTLQPQWPTIRPTSNWRRSGRLMARNQWSCQGKRTSASLPIHAQLQACDHRLDRRRLRKISKKLRSFVAVHASCWLRGKSDHVPGRRSKFDAYLVVPQFDAGKNRRYYGRRRSRRIDRLQVGMMELMGLHNF